MGSRGVTTPSELNELTDNELGAHVSLVLHGLNNGSDPHVPCVAPFVTGDVLLRLHNLVQMARSKGDKCGGWPKQATLAKVVASFTGIKLKRSDAEFVGNAQDSFLHFYRKDLLKARNSDAQELARARKRGREVQPMRALEQMRRVYQCRFGGVPRMGETGRMPLRKLPVPIRSVMPLAEINLQLQNQIVELNQERSAARQEARGNLSTLCAAVEQERSLRERAELRAVEAEVSQQNQAMEAARRVQDLKAKLRDADNESKRVLGQLARLGSQVSAAHVEVAKAQEREKQANEAAQKAATIAAQARADDAAQVAREISRLKALTKTAERERKHAEGQLAILGTQVSLAHLEVARAHEREEKVRIEAVQAAADAKQAQVEAIARATNKLQALQAQQRDSDSELRRADAQIHRLGSQLGAALVEAARAAETAKSARTTAEELRERLHDQEESAALQLSRLRELKAQMARRARAADKRAGEANSLKAELKTVRMKLKEARKNLNSTQVQLNLNTTHFSDEDQVLSDSASSGEESDSDDYHELGEYDAAKQDAADALKRLQSMPTWRATRGKGQGKGEAKLEWGTRLTIYSLLAMMVPPSAIGTVIVAIVKRTAPWLNPAAPTYETVKRCRFELRFVEEALAARRIASAHRIRAIGYDETTKLGNASLTSNVQIEPAKDAPLQDVIVRAAYCPLGGTADLVVSSIETKCFSRLRSFLRRWQEMFGRMFPTEEWTGPNPANCSLHRLGGGGALITDTCNTARKSRELLAELIARQVQEHVGVEAWSAMTVEERGRAVCTHNVDCWQHMRNIFLAEMSRAQVIALARVTARSWLTCSALSFCTRRPDTCKPSSKPSSTRLQDGNV